MNGTSQCDRLCGVGHHDAGRERRVGAAMARRPQHAERKRRGEDGEAAG